LEEIKRISGGSTARKGPIGSTNNQWGEKTPLIEVSPYPALTGSKTPIARPWRK